MKVSKAIEILDTHQCDMPREHVLDLINAIKLGIEALKRHRDKDYTTYAGMHEPLPGEAISDN